MLNALDRELVDIQGLFILGLYEEARKRLTHCGTALKAKDDGFFLDALTRDLEIHELEYELAPPEAMLPRWQRNLNLYAEYRKAGDGSVSPWLWRSERAKLDVNLDKMRNASLPDTLPAHVAAAEAFYKCYLDSGKDDVLSIGRMVFVLLNAQEYALARVVLREMLAHARALFLPYYYAALLNYCERDYERALACYDMMRSRLPMPSEVSPPRILYDECLCHYYLGNLVQAFELAGEGFRLYPDFKGFANNRAFIELRELMRTNEGLVWKDNQKAARIMGEFIDSIKEPGWAGTPHFNIALMMFHGDREDHLEDALAAVKGRRDYKAPTAVKQAFERARNALNKDRDYIHELAAHYYLARVTGGYREDPRRLALDALIWDADNFVTEGAAGARARNAALRKTRSLAKLFDENHLGILKRWCHCPLSIAHRNIDAGGGYFVRWGGHGVAVNPGPGWLKAFARRGYTIDEIDMVLVTAAKYECFGDLEGLLGLIEGQRRGSPDLEPVDLCLHPGVIRQRPDLYSPRLRAFTYTHTLIGGRPVPMKNGVTVTACDPCRECAGARECEGQAMGVSLQVGENEGRTAIGFLSDYCHNEKLVRFMLDSDVIVAALGPVRFRGFLTGEVGQHLGKALTTIRDNEPDIMPSLGFSAQELRSLDLPLPAPAAGYREYCGIDGVVDLWETPGRCRLLILSDMPVDLGDCRQKIARVLNNIMDGGEQRHARVLTGDTGLVVTLPGCQVICEFENAPVPATSIDEECLEGYRLGPVKHFRISHRRDDEIVGFLAATE